MGRREWGCKWMIKGNKTLAGQEGPSDLLPSVMTMVNNNILYTLNMFKECILNVLSEVIMLISFTQ